MVTGRTTVALLGACEITLDRLLGHVAVQVVSVRPPVRLPIVVERSLVV